MTINIISVLIISTITGLATSLGAIFVHIFPGATTKNLSLVLGFAAGIMLALSLFGLLPMAYELSGVFIPVVGFVLGLILMLMLEKAIPSQNMYRHNKSMMPSYLRMGYFIAIGIALHNLPEGMAMGAGFSGSQDMGMLIAVSMLLHNVPEGVGIAAPLKKGGMGLLYILLITAISGIFTPIGALIGWFIGNLSVTFLGLSMSLAAGAMIYICLDELIPESQEQNIHKANIGIIVGLLLTFMVQYL